MTIKHLKIFLEVAKNKSMSKAAENMHFAQSTISQTIKELEMHYDTMLFERLSKRLYITESGKKLELHAKMVIAEFDSLENAMDQESSIEHIRFGITTTCASFLLSSLLNDFQFALPEVHVVSYIHNTHIIEEKLLLGELDIALVEGEIYSSDLIVTPIIDDELVLAFSPKHKFANKASFSSKDLQGEDFVLREDGSGTKQKFEDYLTKNNITIHKKIEAPFPEVIKMALIHNNCLTVISEKLVSEEVNNGEISILRLSGNEWKRKFCLVYHKDKQITASTKHLIELLSAYN